jgi:septal ring factor EnvC (AmiA/AmiB activator)
MHRAWALCALVLGMLALNANGQQVTEIYRCVDADGRRHYTNAKKETAGMKCELVTSQINVAPPFSKPQASTARTPSGFPRESAKDSANARERQREILEKELTAEQQALVKAKQALAEQESVRSGDERNYARVQERLQPFKDTIQNHEKNIAALQRELANLK